MTLTNTVPVEPTEEMRKVMASYFERAKAGECFLFSEMWEEVLAAAPQQPVGDELVYGEFVARMVDRFLSWKLPKDFSPDSGISFKPTKPYEGDEYGNSWWPVGTNLLSADQARAMVVHMLQGIIPPECASSEEQGDAYMHGYFDCETAHRAKAQPAQQQGEPVLYMARNLHNKSYATHPSKAECELYLAQSRLKNDGIEAEVVPLYTTSPSFEQAIRMAADELRKKANLMRVSEGDPYLDKDPQHCEESNSAANSLDAMAAQILALSPPSDSVMMTKAELEELLAMSKVLRQDSLPDPHDEREVSSAFLARSMRDISTRLSEFVSRVLEGKE
jgi:hypothetical protein